MRPVAVICLSALVVGLGGASALWAGDLAGSAWRLLNISSMDDRVDLPDDPDKYTLEFGADGRASLRADCNRGTGTWEADSAGQLEFGPVAAPRAMCPPGSLSDRYLAQFQWVRSFTMKGGHLFLATLADGSIIEFEPMPPVVARVYGEEIRAADADEMRDAVLTRLLDQYASDHGIEAADTDVDAYVDKMRRGMAAEGLAAADELDPDERVELEAMRREMGQALIRQWKINKSLYETYGGRIVYQQLGPEPLDAYRKYLEERQAAGDFSITDPEMKDAFWRYFIDDDIHDFMAPGSKDEAKAFTAAPWLEP